MKFILISLTACNIIFGLFIPKSLVKTQPDTGKLVWKINIFCIKELNLDVVNDEHGDHDNEMQIENVLNHLKNEREFGLLFGNFLWTEIWINAEKWLKI